MYTDYLLCPSRYYYCYVKGWRPEGGNHDLYFGQDIHVGIEALYKGKSVDYAQEKFLASYNSHVDVENEEEDELRSPKNAANGMLAIKQYHKKYFSGAEPEYKLLGQEVNGSLMVGEHEIVYNIDEIVEDRWGKIWVMDHKTASQDRPIDRKAWDLRIQMNVYALGALSIIDIEKFGGVVVDTIILRKKDNAFVRDLVCHSEEYLCAWFESAFSDLYILSQQQKSGIFPIRPTSCTYYGQCPYFNLCNTTEWFDRKNKEMPIGFIESHWNPKTREEEKR